MPAVKLVLYRMAAAGAIRLTERDDVFYVARPKGNLPEVDEEGHAQSPLRVKIQEDSSWVDSRGISGQGLFAMGRHLRLPLEALIHAIE